MNNIDQQRLSELNAGSVETRTLMEALAIDLPHLIKSAFPKYDAASYCPTQGITRRMAHSAEQLLSQYGPSVVRALSEHNSDTLRGIACYAIAQTMPHIPNALDAIYPLANDRHFGVREWAWLALRPVVLADIDHAILLLTPWAIDTSPYIRRFASEITRPRGVWSAHSAVLKKDPARGLPILEELKADPEKYVQLSVGNWLNDAYKNNPEWVVRLCEGWEKESKNSATAKICKRALRSAAREN